MRENLNIVPDTYRKLAPETDCVGEGHNSAQYLEVVWLEGIAGWLDRFGPVLPRGEYRPNMRGKLPVGWYIVRICPQHRGQIVSRRYDTEDEAAAGVRLLVEVTMLFDT